MSNQKKVLFPLRQVEIFPTEEDGEKLVVLNDPSGFAPGMVTLSMAAIALLSLCEETSTPTELISRYHEKFGVKVSDEEVLLLFDQLEKAYLLDSPRFAAHSENIKEEFNKSKTRPAILAGVSYSDNRVELSSHIEQLLDSDDTAPANGAKVRGIVSPHIDFRVGADLMAAGWKNILSSDADLFILLGTGHYLSEDFFSCIDKDFETPLGAVPVESQFLKTLEENFGENIYGEVDAHRREHSIEFQTLFMAHIFSKRPNVKIVPILFSFPEHSFKIDHPKFGGARIDRFAKALQKSVSECGKKVCFVASVDFAHVGARFGDPAPLGDDLIGKIESDDKRLITALEKWDMESFMDVIYETNETNRVCGFPPLYIMLRVLCGVKGNVLGYRQNIEGEKESMVSFAAMTLTSNE